MGSLNVRDLDDEVLIRLRRRAARHGRSAEAEARVILQHSVAGDAEPDFAELAARMRALTAGRAHTPAEILQREGRDER
jgi:plasmid stability protein